MPVSTPLYVQRLILKNIRCFADLNIEFPKRKSIVIIGDNGDGKSTILRSLAMGICDLSSASALFRELYGEYVRLGSEKGSGTIAVELSGGGSYRYRIETKITSLDAFERVDQRVFRLRGKEKKELTQDNFPWHRIFASGYGAGIRVQGTSDFEHSLTVDAVYPLFRYDVLLQNPELIVRRLMDAARQRGDDYWEVVLTEIKELLARVLQLDGPERIHLDPNGIFIQEASGKVGLSALSDGFRGTITWVLDLISWWFLHLQDWGGQRSLDVQGIVLIDEIEQHLHPRWQRNVMRLLRDTFPHVQFIATTHSPLVASGCEGIPVIRVKDGTHDVVEPFGWLAEDVYEKMGVPSSRAEAFREGFLAKFTELDLKRLSGLATKPELRHLKALGRELDMLPETDPLRLTTEIENMKQQLKDMHSPPSDRS